VSSTSSNPNGAAPLRLLAETAALFREETFALDHLVQDLYRDIEQLRDELTRKGDELEEGRRKLAQERQKGPAQSQESAKLVQLVEAQEKRLAEAVGEIKSFREQSQGDRKQAEEREASRMAFLEQQVRTTEAERDQLRHELQVLQASAAANPGSSGATSESLAPLMSELGDMRRQLAETQNQLGEARTQLSAAIDRAAAAASQAQPVIVNADGQPADPQTQERLGALERERVELESELELVRTRATELQEIVNQQRRELVEQRADITTELRLLRELVESRPQQGEFEGEDEALVAAASHSEPLGSAPDPVVSSVMAQFARLQKDVAQRRKKK